MSIKNTDVVIRLSIAHQVGGGHLQGRPTLCRPKDKTAVGILSCIRLQDLRVDLACLSLFGSGNFGSWRTPRVALQPLNLLSVILMNRDPDKIRGITQ